MTRSHLSRSLCAPAMKARRRVLFAALLAGAACALCLTNAARAAIITFSAATTISGSADVSAVGLSSYAYDLNNSTQTVNGVSFTGTNSTTTLGSNVTLSGFNGGNATSTYGSASSPFSGLPSNYQTVLSGGDYTIGATAVTVTLNNLTSGHQYATQVWVDDSRGGYGGRSETVTGGGGNTVTLNYNTNNNAGSLGQYTTGYFTASAGTQSFTLQGNTSTQLNALQLRDVTNLGYWNGTVATAGTATWDSNTTANFCTNVYSAAFANGTFSQATNLVPNVYFGDYYYDSGSSGGTAAVGTSTIKIAAGGVSTGTVTFLNNAAAYTLTSSGSAGITGATAVVLQGTGLVTFAGSNSYTGTTTISGGTLAIGGGGCLGSGGNYAGAIVTSNSGALVVKTTSNQTFGGLISGPGAMYQQGSGVTTISHTDSYTGATTVSGGTLVLNDGNTGDRAGSTLASTAININPGAVVALNNTCQFGWTATPTFTINGGTLTTANGTYQDTTPTLVLSNSATVALGSGGWSFTTPVAGTVQMFGLQSITASGTGNQITGAGGNSGIIDPRGPLTVQVTNPGDQLTIGAQIGQDGSNTTSLSKTGSGTLTLTGVNFYTGATTISGGTLQLGNGGTAGALSTSSTSSIVDNAALAFNRSDTALSISQVISGSGAVYQNGSGMTTLSNSNTLSGPVVVNGGTLSVTYGNNDAHGCLGHSSSLTINSGATVTTVNSSQNNNLLGGQGGTIATVTTINAGGRLMLNGYLQSLGPVTMAGGTLASAAVSGSYGGANLGSSTPSGSDALTAGGPGVQTSVISAPGVTITQPGGTVFDVAANGTPGYVDLNVTGTLSDASSLTCTGLIKKGAGLMLLSSSNNYSGGTTVSGGTLLVVGGGEIYSTLNADKANAITVNGGVLAVDNWGWQGNLGELWYSAPNIVVNGGTLAYVGSTANGSAARMFTIGASGATLVSGSAGQKWAVTSGGAYTSLGSNGGPLVLAGAGNGEIDAIIPGSGGLTMAGGGTWTLGGANTYTGATAVNAGTLSISGGYLSSSSSISIASGAAITTSVGHPFGGGGSVGAAWSISGTLANVNGSAATVSVPASVTLNNGTMSGNATTNAGYGFFFVGDAGAANTLTATGSANTISAYNIGIGYSSSISWTLTTPSSSDALTVSSIIGAPTSGAASGSLIKAGSGIVALTGANIYTGATTISGGTLAIGGSGYLGGGNYAAAISNSGALVVNTSSNQTFSGLISGGGTLYQAGGGVTLLTNTSNSFSGGLIVAGGVLRDGGTNPSTTGPLGTGPITIQNGATVDINGQSNTVNTFTIAGTGAAGQQGRWSTWAPIPLIPRCRRRTSRFPATPPSAATATST